MREPFKQPRLPGLRDGLVRRPWRRVRSKGSEGPDRQYPGSDPDIVGDQLFDERGVDVAILHPMTRGIMPDRHLGTAIAAGAQRDDGVALARRRRLRAIGSAAPSGSIPTTSPARCARSRSTQDHPTVVQIGVPLQSREVYGKPQYWPLWEAAVDANLPVAVHIEVGAGLSFAPTPSGVTRTYEQYVGFMALNYLYHLMNMIAEGVFERMPELKFVWADGAADMLTPFMWRMDCFGRPHLEQTPWAPKMPSDYLPGTRLFRPGRDGRPRRHRIRR